MVGLLCSPTPPRTILDVYNLADLEKHQSARHRCSCPYSRHCFGLAASLVALAVVRQRCRCWMGCGSSCCHHHHLLDHGGGLAERLSPNAWLIGLTSDVPGYFVSRSRVRRPVWLPRVFKSSMKESMPMFFTDPSTTISQSVLPATVISPAT